MNDLLTLGEVARYLRMSRATVQRWCRDRRLPATKIGKEYRIRREDLDTWYQQMQLAEPFHQVTNPQPSHTIRQNGKFAPKEAASV